MLLLSKYRSHLLKVLLQKAIYLAFLGVAILSKSNITPRIRQKPPQKPKLISPTHKRTEGGAPVWGSEFTSKDAALQGGIQQKPLLG
jgi:hypothetical protein